VFNNAKEAHHGQVCLKSFKTEKKSITPQASTENKIYELKYNI
jgi:hypothetical protein